jgi:MFS family permease
VAGAGGQPDRHVHEPADVSIVNLALPSIERDLGASAGTVQWVVSGYALALGLALVPAGRDDSRPLRS